jgi:hypothetical protein
MTEPVEDVGSLPGRKLIDQVGNPVGKVKEIYATDEGYPMWIAVDLATGLFGKRTVFVPLAWVKDEDGQVRVPYSRQRISEAPEIDSDNGISPECDRRLRGYYGIDTGDQEFRSDNKSSAARVVEEGGASERIDDPSHVVTPDADMRTEESIERLRDPGSSETRKVTAADVAHDDQDASDDSEA